jgi:hypothetical protein
MLLLLLFVVHLTIFIIHKNSIATSGLITMPTMANIHVGIYRFCTFVIVFKYRNELESQLLLLVHQSFHHLQQIHRLIEQYVIHVFIRVEQNQFRLRKMVIVFYVIYHLNPVSYQWVIIHIMFGLVIFVFYYWINDENSAVLQPNSFSKDFFDQ